MKIYFYSNSINSSFYYFVCELERSIEEQLSPSEINTYHLIGDLSKIDYSNPCILIIFRNLKPLDFFRLRFKYIKHLTQVFYFIDDDLLNLKPFLSLPPLYSTKIWLRSLGFWLLLAFTKIKLVVATNYLMSKYRKFNPLKVSPKEMLGTEKAVKQKDNVSISQQLSNLDVYICYHGSWSHKNEIKWLIPIIREVQNRCHNTIFEIIGGERIAKLFKGIPRVKVLNTMPWSEYLQHTLRSRQDIGLAPLMDTYFNRGRGPIKFFDYTRAGAVGIYSKSPAFTDFVSDGIDGFLLDNDPQLWIKNIIWLANNIEQRQAMADKAQGKLLENSSASKSMQDYLNGIQT